MSATEIVDRFLEVGIRAARQAGQIAASMQPALLPEQVYRKTDGSPTTQADMDADGTMVGLITRSFPGHKVCSEESGWHNQDSDSPYTWVVDPVDGTWALINQENTASVSLALLKEGSPIVGVVYNPFTAELYHVAEGQASMLGERVLPIKRPVPRGRRIGVVNFQLGRRYRRQVDCLLDLWTEKDRPIGKLLSLGGSVAYGLALVAKGAHDALVTVMGRKPDPWDLAAGVLLVRNAGGKVTDVQGHDIDPISFEGYLVASTYPEDHERVLELLRESGFPLARSEP